MMAAINVWDQVANSCLSKREHECLLFLLWGLSTKDIARRLSLSPRTIESHIERLKCKMNCDSRRTLIAKAIREGYLNEISRMTTLVNPFAYETGFGYTNNADSVID